MACEYRRAVACVVTAAAFAVTMAVPVAAAPRTPAECGQPHPQAHPLGERPWSLQVLRPENVWPLSRGGGVTVAVIDSGVSPDHPTLGGGKVLAGHDFVDEVPGGFCDTHGHGTFIAGVIAGRQVRGDAFSGIAPEAQILPLRVMADSSGDLAGRTPERVARAIDYAVGRKVGVINLSLYTPDTPAVAAAIDRALRANVVVVAAAGNSEGEAGRRFYPAAYPGVLAVAGVEEHGRRVASSHRGDYVGVAAPGAAIEGPTVHGGGYVTEAAGTSFAAAYVSGVVALLRGYRPQLTAAEVVHRIVATADHPPAGRDDEVGYGVVNPYRAVATETDSAALAARGDALPPAASEPEHERLARLVGPWLVAMCLGLAVAVGVLAWALPRGGQRGWRPGRRADSVSPARSLGGL